MTSVSGLPCLDVSGQLNLFPRIRFMGSKVRLLPWIQGVLSELRFNSALDAFSGAGSVSYLLKAMGKRVVTNDRLALSHIIGEALIANNRETLSNEDVELLTTPRDGGGRFIEETFSGIFFTPPELRFLDVVWSNLDSLSSHTKRSMAIAALLRSCAKRQPRGVFTVAGDPERYKDGRRDLRLTLAEHFVEQTAAFGAAVFENGERNAATRRDVFDAAVEQVDLVYMDPPYVPRADDNCYIKRYHFLEGLATYWREGEIQHSSRVKKLKKPFTPFSYRRTADDAFDRLFRSFADATIVLSYSSNAYPDLADLVRLLQKYKGKVEVHTRDHRYHFGTHGKAERNRVTEYLIVGVE